MYFVRSTEALKSMKSAISPSYQVEDFLSPLDVQELLAAFWASSEKEVKPNGPICAAYKGNAKIDRRALSLTGARRILGTSLFFSTAVPHVLHIDCPKESRETPFKAVLLPLAAESEGPSGPFDISFFTFEQHWYGQPAKFFRGERRIFSPHNVPVYEYSGLENLKGGMTVLSADERKQLGHIHPRWLDGLSIESSWDWKIGSAIVFDSYRVHCAGNFPAFGVRAKTGLSIFTTLFD
jgi:hypothetical protein